MINGGELGLIKARILELLSYRFSEEESQAQTNYRKFLNDMSTQSYMPLERVKDEAELRRLEDIARQVIEAQEKRQDVLSCLRDQQKGLELELIDWQKHRTHLTTSFKEKLDADIAGFDRKIEQKEYIVQREQNALMAGINDIESGIEALETQLQTKPNLFGRQRTFDTIGAELELERLKLDKQNIISNKFPKLKPYLEEIEREIKVIQKTKDGRLRDYNDALNEDNANIERLTGEELR